MPVSSLVEVVPGVMLTSRQVLRRAEVTERRKALYEDIQQRLVQGESLRVICLATGLSRGTVRRYVRSADVPERAERLGRTKLDRYAVYLRERWMAGCHNASQLHREIVGLGYGGSYTMLREYIRRWREKPCRSSGEHTARVYQVVWKDMRWAILRPSEHLQAEEAKQLAEFLAMHPALKHAYDLVQALRRMLRKYQVEELDPWLAEAAQCELPPLQRVAKSLATDRAAVLAAVQLQWSTGPVEGQITRLKLLKRIGYSLPLLRARVTGIV